jgi:hypothetical protein
MAELDPLIARVLLEGDDEFLASLKKVGESAAESFEKLAASIEKVGVTFANAASGLGLVEAAIAGVTAATVLFVEQQTELSQRTVLLAEAFGTTAGQLQELEAVFASSGVKVQQFERFANRLTITIAREWPQIAESVKTYANEHDAATLRVTNATLGIRDAQNALSDNSAERFAQMAKDSNALEAAYIKLQFAAQHAASEQLAALQSVRSAQLGVTAAEQHLAELEGRPPSAAEKQNLALAQAQGQVDAARRAEADARIAQQEKAAEAALKVRQQEQAYADLSRKAAKDARDDAEQREKDENRLKSAIIARGEAEEKVNKLALTSVVSIRSALDEVVNGEKGAKTSVDLTAVSVQNLIKGIIAQAAAHSKATEPSGYETLIQLSKTLSKATEEQISQEQKLAIVNRLAGTSMQALGASAAEILNVLTHDAQELEKFANAAKSLDTKEAKKAIEDFRGALAGLNLTISILSQQFAIAISPAFTAFLRAIQSSIESNNGVIRNFIDGVTGILHAIDPTTEAFQKFLDKLGLFDENVGKVDALKAALIGIGTAITVATGPIGVMVVAIGLVITAIGSVRDNWDTIVAATRKAWEAVKDNSVIRFFERLLDLVAKIKSALSGTGWKNPAASTGGDNAKTGDQASETTPTSNFARGGAVEGPGSGTSDSILARLSNGEFVMKASAVAAYGTGLFHALNNMQLPGFAAGGLVASPVRLAGGGSVPATSVLNLSIDGKSFNGLRGPKSTIDDLSSFAIARQASAAGNNPSWVK